MTPAASHAEAAPPLAPRRRVGPGPRPRRISGPVRPAPRPQAPAPRPQAPASRQRAAEGGLALGLIGLAGRVDSLASHRFFDRLIRSRLWIGIVAFALIGIVTLQLGLLRLNSGIGRALEREGVLQRENAALRVEDSELAAGARVESQAGQLGMRLVSIGGLAFAASHGRADLARAAAALEAAPAHEAAAPASEGSAASTEGESSTGASGEAGGEAGGEAAPAEGASSESEASGGGSSAASSGESAESSEASASAGSGSEASSEPVPAGEGGGAAAPGG